MPSRPFGCSMGPKESDQSVEECELRVHMASSTPVFGCQINPTVRAVRRKGSLDPLPQHKLTFTWYREQISSSSHREKIHCCIHLEKLATVQCVSCVTLDLPLKGSYHCSNTCYSDAWKKHEVHHRYAAQSFCETEVDNQPEVRKIRSCGSWSDYVKGLLPDENAMVVEREGKAWIKVGSSKSYLPTEDDIGFCLRLECVAVDSSVGTHLSPINIIVTDPVIYPPAHQPRTIKCLWKTRNSDLKAHSSKDVTFSVLSYNLLSDLYAGRNRYSYCPTWALSWDYRQQNLLHEIIDYDADILCLQEVQSNHFENFFKPQLTKCGYSVIYKKKTKELYTANHYTIDGCATFYRRDRFKEIKKYELEFDKSALAVVEALEPGLRSEGSFRLLKDNVALVVILETLESEGTCDGIQPRICVANTHIHANLKFPDVKLFQIVDLINGLEKIAELKIPLLVCGDLNSLPLSNPHRFVSTGRLDNPLDKETDPLGIFQHLKLHHSLPLVSAYACFFRSDGIEEQQRRKMGSETNEPVFTNFVTGFRGTLDYIFYTADSLEVEGVLELLDHEALGAGLPSPDWSSDHIAIMGRFRLKTTSHKQCSQPLPHNPWQRSADAQL